ncbi:unnamed protein product [Leuciscus chuanchicus]
MIFAGQQEATKINVRPFCVQQSPGLYMRQGIHPQWGYCPSSRKQREACVFCQNRSKICVTIQVCTRQSRGDAGLPRIKSIRATFSRESEGLDRDLTDREIIAMPSSQEQFVQIGEQSDGTALLLHILQICTALYGPKTCRQAPRRRPQNIFCAPGGLWQYASANPPMYAISEDAEGITAEENTDFPPQYWESPLGHRSCSYSTETEGGARETAVDSPTEAATVFCARAITARGRQLGFPGVN